MILGAASLGFTSRGDAECIQMRNHGNVQYTISSFEIGGQQLDVIPDTGSSDLVVPSESCANCGYHRRYSSARSASASFPQNDTQFIASYGQGEVIGQLVRDVVSIGDANSYEVTFLDMQDCRLQSYVKGAAFDGILGLGPKQFTSDGRPTLTSQFHHAQVGMCLGLGDGAPGALFVDAMPGDDADGGKKAHWVELPMRSDDQHYVVRFDAISVSTGGGGGGGGGGDPANTTLQSGGIDAMVRCQGLTCRVAPCPPTPSHRPTTAHSGKETDRAVRGLGGLGDGRRGERRGMWPASLPCGLPLCISRSGDVASRAPRRSTRARPS